MGRTKAPIVDELPSAMVVRKYTELCEKYKLLVARQHQQAVERIGLYKLARWALRTSSSGLALVSAGELIVQNARWVELGGAGVWGWRPLGPYRVGGFASLRELTLAEADHWLHATSDVAVTRFARDDGLQTIEVRLERDASVGSDTTVAVLVHDVTSQVRDELELARARELLGREERMRALGEVTSGVAHDLNNTLHAIRMRLEMVRSGGGTATAGADLEAAVRILGEASQRVRLLQDFARRRADRPQETLELAHVIAGAIEVARSAVEAGSKFRIETQLPRLPAVVGADAEVRHVFLNLILNARDAMPEGGTVRIAGHRATGAVVVTVTDEGAGIAAANLPRIFDPFFTTKEAHGSGLGLSMAWGVMTRLGGSIAAHNGEGGGCCFTLRFPLPSRKARAKKVVRGARRPVRLRILIVDDDRESLLALKRLLVKRKHRVDAAAGGPQALDFLRSGARYDLVLTDLGMPTMDGWAVAHAARELAPSSAVWVLTGRAHELADVDPRRAQVDVVLSKPLEIGRLEKMLAVLGGKVQRRPD